MNKKRAAQVAELRSGGFTYGEIAERLGITKSCVQYYMRQLDLIGDAPITKKWLTDSGVGKAWDLACANIRLACTRKRKKFIPSGNWDVVCEQLRNWEE